MCQITAPAIMTFASRAEAGQRLGRYLAEQNVQADVVLGLPRGGVIVAAEVARVLGCPLDVLIVRKIGHPGHREFAVGALAEDGTLVLDEGVIGRTGVSQTDLRGVLAEETRRLTEYQARFLRPHRPPLKGRSVLIVDDGLATGATTEAAVRSARNREAAEVIIAAPVASDNAVERLERVADKVLALIVDPEFDAVGRYYRSFPQTADEEVQAILDAAGQSG
ncbi:MAG: phosphoribosyl transferase [Verrucomicrobia bacterium]|nr:MAG: phosphoribosyl transferase [Verrucomicrobiota bacterium]